MIIMVNALAIWVMIYIIAKLKWEHKNIDPYKHGCISNTNHVNHEPNYHDI